MLKVHNSKVNKITGGYKEYCELRERSKTEGIPFEELKAQVDENNDLLPKKAKKGKKGGKKKKTFKAGFGGGCEILMKDKDGNVINYDSNQDEEPEADQEEQAEESKIIEVEAPKKKKVKKEVEGIENE